jgi:hypothetical protein
VEHDALPGAGTAVPATWPGAAALERAWTGGCGALMALSEEERGRDGVYGRGGGAGRWPGALDVE